MRSRYRAATPRECGSSASMKASGWSASSASRGSSPVRTRPRRPPGSAPRRTRRIRPGIRPTVRSFNFAAGPATLPVEVLEQAREELTDWQGLGASVMEVSHRGKPFLAMAREAESDLRELLAVPSGYRVLFMQGGGASQFSVVPRSEEHTSELQ